MCCGVRRAVSRKEHRETHRGAPLRKEADIRVMPPHAQEGLEPPKARRGKKGFFPRAFRRSVALSVLRFWTSSL